jgi:hypothetical protein
VCGVPLNAMKVTWGMAVSQWALPVGVANGVVVWWCGGVAV